MEHVLNATKTTYRQSSLRIDAPNICKKDITKNYLKKYHYNKLCRRPWSRTQDDKMEASAETLRVIIEKI